MLAIFLWTALGCIAVYPALKKDPLSEAGWLKFFLLFSVALAFALPVWRFRSLTYNGEINVDESSILAQAMRYLEDPVPWRSVNGGSGGPLNTWVLLWAPLAGLKLSYSAARITGLACTFLIVVPTALGIREMVGNRFSLLLTLPMTLLLCCTLNLDFVHFSSEQLPSAMSAWAVWLILLQLRQVSLPRAFVLGLITGAMPFTKLQVAPAGIALFVAAFLTTTIPIGLRSAKIRAGLLLAAGGLTVPAAILIPVAVCGAWSDFIEFYIMEGLRYRNTLTPTAPSAIDFLLRGSEDFKVYWTAFGAMALACLCFRLFKSAGAWTQRANRWIVAVICITGYLLLMTHLATRTGMGFPHYLMLLIAPVSMWAASCVADPEHFLARPITVEAENLSPRGHSPWLLTAVLFVLGLQTLTFRTIYKANPQFVRDWGNSVHPLVSVILEFAGQKDHMFVWGWAPKFHVLTGIPPATRFASNGLMTGSGDVPELYHRRLREDLEKAKPRLILDATEEFRWPTWPPGFLAGHQAMPELARITFSEYRQVKRIDIRPGGQPFIIFERK